MKIVFDTNVYVSHILRGGLPSQAIQVAALCGFPICVSAEILTEVREVLERHGLPAGRAAAHLREIKRTARLVRVDPRRNWVATLTAKDNAILAAAVAANADYLVTGDNKLRAVGRVRRTRIVTPREFMTILVHAGCLVRADF